MRLVVSRLILTSSGLGATSTAIASSASSILSPSVASSPSVTTLVVIGISKLVALVSGLGFSALISSTKGRGPVLVLGVKRWRTLLEVFRLEVLFGFFLWGTHIPSSYLLGACPIF